MHNVAVVQKVGHIFWADAQGGTVVQQSRGGRRQDARHAQHNQRQVKAHNKALAAVDALHQCFAEFAQCHQRKKIV